MHNRRALTVSSQWCRFNVRISANDCALFRFVNIISCTQYLLLCSFPSPVLLYSLEIGIWPQKTFCLSIEKQIHSWKPDPPKRQTHTHTHTHIYCNAPEITSQTSVLKQSQPHLCSVRSSLLWQCFLSRPFCSTLGVYWTTSLHKRK